MTEHYRICFVISSLNAGGAERVICNLSNELAGRGHAVTIILTYKDIVKYELNPAIRVTSLNCHSYENGSLLWKLPHRWRDIRTSITSTSPDIVISFIADTNIDVCLALLGTGIPLIVSERNDPCKEPASLMKRLLRRLAYLRPQGFVFQTEDAQNYFSKRIQKKSSIILNPLVTQLPAPSSHHQRDKRIVAVGRLQAQKNFKLLIDAFHEFAKAHPDYTLEIYGEGPLRDELLSYIRAANLEDKVLLNGYCSDVHERIRTADMFVMSSDFEGMPNALMEAMAMGIPCISTDCPCGGPRTLIDSYKNGILVPRHAPKTMAEAMSYLVTHPTEAEAMAEEATSLRERTHVSRITDAWLDFMRSCMAKTQ